MTRNDLGDARELFGTPGVWAGKSKAASTSGVHAVNEMQAEGPASGSRKAVCGLTGRYLVDARLTGGRSEFVKVPVDQRCPACHKRWIEMAGDQ